MAKKKTEQKSKSFADVLGVKNIFNNEKADFVLGFFVLCLAVCTIIAMISYLSTGHISCIHHPGIYHISRTAFDEG